MKSILIAHRGARLNQKKSIIHVENSMEAIKAGLKLVDGIEIDTFFINGTWWISHDYDLKRLNSNHTLETATKETIISQNNISTRLLSMDELISKLKDQPLKSKKYCNIEIKKHAEKININHVFNLIKTINESGINDKLTFYYSSFDTALINTLKEHVTVGYLCKSLDDIKKIKPINNNVFVITIQHTKNSPQMIEEITKQFGNILGIYFKNETDYFKHASNYQSIAKVIYCEPIIQ